MMPQARAQTIARDIRIAATVCALERQALDAALREAGTGSSVPASLPATRKPRGLPALPEQHQRLRRILLRLVARR
jgi:hypothetical protein